jgi:hypothetical protein
MASQKVENGWRERAGLEKRRSKPKAEGIVIDPNQLTIWDAFAELDKLAVDKPIGGSHD